MIRRKHFSIRTEEAYTNWVRRFILFHGKRPKAQNPCCRETIETILSCSSGSILRLASTRTKSRLRGCLFHIAFLAGLLEPRLNRRSAVFGNFVLPFP